MIIAVLTGGLLLPGCASVVKVHTVKPQETYHELAMGAPLTGVLSPGTRQVLRIHELLPLWPAHPRALLRALERLGNQDRNVTFARVEIALLSARTAEEQGESDAAGLYADAARRAWMYLFGLHRAQRAPTCDPHELMAIFAYDDATARVIESLQNEGTAPSSGWKLVLPGQITLLVKPGPGRWHLANFNRLQAADRLQIRRFQDRFTRFGIGAPFAGLIPHGAGPVESRWYPPKGLAVPVTAILRFGPAAHREHGDRMEASLELLDVRKTARLTINGRSMPTAADFTAPYAYLAALGEKQIQHIGAQGMFSPGATRSLHRMILMEPYDPHKIPLVLVHGLWSNPSIWLPLTNEIEGDPVLRRSYQIWYFLYPSGEPFLWTAAMFRDALDQVRHALDPSGTNPAMNQMVLIGHSMGGLLVKTTVSASGTALWDSIFTVPPSKLHVPQIERSRLEHALFFSPKPYVHRVIFLSTPQHGSRMAASIIGKLGSALVRLPHSFSQMLRDVARHDPQDITPAMRAIFEKGGPDAVRALRPDHPVMKAFARLAIAPNVPFHTIIGDRGLDGGTHASDGVVSWKSAHLAGAASETIVPCGHHSTANRQAMNTILYILRLNLRGLEHTLPSSSVGQRHPLGEDVLDLKTPHMAHAAAIADVPRVVGDQP